MRLKVSELIEQLKEVDPDLDVCRMGSCGHGEPAFPELIDKISVEVKQFYTGEKKLCLLLKGKYE